MYRRLVKIGTYGFTAVMVFFLALIGRAWLGGQFDSVESFQRYMADYGVFAPVMLMLFQVAQVIVPIFPGLLGCAAGSMMFGCLGGFLCNYIGISAGSVIAFLLARNCGAGLVNELFRGSKYNKWASRAGKSRSYVAFVFLAMLLPLFPDDYICYLTGLTKMPVKKFVWIILLGKPWCILAYSLGFSLLK